MGRVDGKIALVTGGGQGLGKAASEMLAREGATVVVTDVTLAPAAAVADAIGGGAIALALDVQSEEAWSAAIAEVERRFGRLDVLVNNAGVVVVADIEDTSLAQFRWVNAIMSEGVFLGCKAAIPLMARSARTGCGGSIINMSSTGALLGYPVFFAYAAAKGAVRAMTKSLAITFQDKGYRIRCNSVHPGAIETPMVQNASGRPGVEEQVRDGVLPPGSNGAPADVASLILYLASDESRFMTGAELVIDNGLVIRP